MSALEGDPRASRRDFERPIAGLVGRRLLGVRYSDIHLFGENRVWDFESWHHAVMGVELLTDEGPVSLLWSNVFGDYGIEVAGGSLSDHLRGAPEGPEVWDVSEHPSWQARRGGRVARAAVCWVPWGVGSATFDVPVALRIDFDAGADPVWFIVCIPVDDSMDGVGPGGDEMVAVFDGETMAAIGWTDRESWAVVPRLDDEKG